MAKEETYDVVIIGAGHNGTTTAAYLAKCGLSVCVLEERPECGGAQETVEPMAGVRIQPHAIGNYGGSAPGWEQLELWRYGFRMDWNPSATVPFEDRALHRSPATGSSPVRTRTRWAGPRSPMLAASDPPCFKDLHARHVLDPAASAQRRADETHDPLHAGLQADTSPDCGRKELLEMTMFDLMDEYLETEPFKVDAGVHRHSAPARIGHLEGVAIPALAVVATVLPPAVAKPVAARGNMHGYYHALFRCAVAHGAIFRTCCPVEEIIVRTVARPACGCATTPPGARRRSGRNKAVISAAHIKPTFLKLIGPRAPRRRLPAADQGPQPQGRQPVHEPTSSPGRSSATARKFKWRNEEPHLHRRLLLHGVAARSTSRTSRCVIGRQQNLTLPPDEAMWGMVASQRCTTPPNRSAPAPATTSTARCG